MAQKRPRGDAAAGQPKKPRTAFKVGPDNLPDGTWRRKVTKIKKSLIHKAKLKKSYAKIKALEPPVEKPVYDHEPLNPLTSSPKESPVALHPERQAMLDAPQELTPQPRQTSRPRTDWKRSRKPAYFAKETAYAEQRSAEAEARRLEFERKGRERKERIEERERFRRAMAKARVGGQRKLGRESKVLLERVKKIVGM